MKSETAAWHPLINSERQQGAMYSFKPFIIDDFLEALKQK